MKRDVRVYIVDILESLTLIEEYTRSLSKEEFCRNSQVQDAVLRRFEIVGEAAKHIAPDVRRKYPTIPWSKLAGLRDVLIHEYFGVNLDRVWKFVKDENALLREKLQEVKAELERTSTRRNAKFVED